MEQEFQINGTTLTVRLPKEIDHHNAEEIRTEADRILQRKLVRVIVFDFKKTEFMDSSGFGFVMGRYKTVSSIGGKVSVTGCKDRIAKLLKMSGADRFVKIEGRVK